MINNIQDTEKYQDYKKALVEYKKDKRKELIQLFKNLGLEESLNMFKFVEGKGLEFYGFYEDEVDFINQLYDEYSGPLISIRKYQINKLSDEYAVKLYEDIFKLFTRRGLSDEEAYEKTKLTYNILDYPVRRKQLAIKKMKEQMEKITNLIMEERVKNITSRNDDYAWIEYVNKDLAEMVNKYIRLYDVMAELRQCEINDYAEQQFLNMTDDEIEQMKLEENSELRVYSEWKSLPRVRELDKQRRKITQEPVDARELISWKPRTDYTLKERERLRKIDQELNQLYDETEIKVQKEIISEKDLQPFLKKQEEYGFKGLRTSKQLLEAALIEIEDEKDFISGGAKLG